MTVARTIVIDQRNLQRVALNGKCSHWKLIDSGAPQGSILGPLFFLGYINDQADNVNCCIKLLSNASLELNKDLESVSLWAWQWKMLFNIEKTKEVIFSSKRSKPQHPPLNLGSDVITRKTEHKHLGMILDENLNFKSYIREAILKARRGIGMIKFLSKYVSVMYLT